MLIVNQECINESDVIDPSMASCSSNYCDNGICSISAIPQCNCFEGFIGKFCNLKISDITNSYVATLLEYILGNITQGNLPNYDTDVERVLNLTSIIKSIGHTFEEPENDTYNNYIHSLVKYTIYITNKLQPNDTKERGKSNMQFVGYLILSI